MKKVLLIGGSGSIGKAFIREYYNKYEFYNVSRNENHQFELEIEFPKVTNYIASIEDIGMLDIIFDKVKPDIVIHLAAIKHIEMAQRQPIITCKVNIIGSLNIISMCRKYSVPVTIGISTDKACASEGVYGESKHIMERCFIEANAENIKFALCRFANVANSSSSIIPNWKKLRDKGIPLKVTDKRMNRMMFSLSDAAKFIQRTINQCDKGGGFIAVKTDMKSVNIYDLAKSISDNIEIIGKRTSVEKFDEDLIIEKELPFTYVIDKGYTMLLDEMNMNDDNRLKDVYNTKNAETMNEEDIQKLVYGKK